MKVICFVTVFPPQVESATHRVPSVPAGHAPDNVLTCRRAVGLHVPPPQVRLVHAPAVQTGAETGQNPVLGSGRIPLVHEEPFQQRQVLSLIVCPCRNVAPLVGIVCVT